MARREGRGMWVYGARRPGAEGAKAGELLILDHAGGEEIWGDWEAPAGVDVLVTTREEWWAERGKVERVTAPGLEVFQSGEGAAKLGDRLGRVPSMLRLAGCLWNDWKAGLGELEEAIRGVKYAYPVAEIQAGRNLVGLAMDRAEKRAAGAAVVMAGLGVLGVRPMGRLAETAALGALEGVGLVRREEMGWVVDEAVKAAAVVCGRMRGLEEGSWEWALGEAEKTDWRAAELAMAVAHHDWRVADARRVVALLERLGLELAERGYKADAMRLLGAAYTAALPTGEGVRIGEHMAAVQEGKGRASVMEIAAGEERERAWKAERARELGKKGEEFGLRGELLEAAEAYWEAIRLREEAAGKMDGERARLLTQAALVFEARGRGFQGERMAKESLVIRRKLVGRGALEFAQSANNLGMIQRRQGKLPSGERHLRAALRVYRAHGDKRGEATALGNLAVLLEERGRREESGECYERAIGLFVASGGEADEQGNRMRASYARQLWEAGERERAVAMAELAYRHHLAVLGEAHPWTRDSRERWEDLRG